ncbi:hypothetical protein DACRYDRAFT_115208 [Dacryopinax primogenitus]|uniref:RRM domain-containing protein n=1 Tax=Dacryopinax primogenitus (strain DJM 731) TaxID=1858805 RepID=M5GF73_DACPD|nr:uncharacterized protein DACRYDRAFT_115208 [Dacryopinax primogenitus]EJU03908.1 hypothetical protein DACRYDRAFT_115208 [Dacryopinax primogenitus]
MSEELITTRLHIAGLTPSITASDLQARFSSFGTVLALDGLHLPDGLGEPRKFAYLTLQSTPVKLKRCMNVLSGTMYKGAKLRIGEAKMDYTARWEKEHADAVREEEQRAGKRRKMERVKEAKDMSLVTVNNVEGRLYWHVTALNHLIRPIRMRPLRPLPPLPELASSSKPMSSKKALSTVPLKRARRMVIDPPKWGAVHLTGALLEAGEVILPDRERGVAHFAEDPAAAPLEGTKKSKKRRAPAEPEPPAPAPLPKAQEHAARPPMKEKGRKTDDVLALIEGEKSAGLDLIRQMFGEGMERAERWVDEDSDMEVEHPEWNRNEKPEKGKGKEVRVEREEQEHEPVEEEEDAAEAEDEQEQEEESTAEVEEEPAEEQDEDESSEEEPEAPASTAQPTGGPEPVRESLKDLFAPREETGGFTLDLDLDDLDIDPTLAPVPLPSFPARPVQPLPSYDPPTTEKSDWTAYPLFFPTWDEEGKPVEHFAHGAGGRRRAKTFWDVAREKGWTEGWKQETEDEARERWEKVRGPLTQEWKKRSREAKRRKKATALGGVGEGM